jgi:cyclophilin family peptidyl-prolyl cis-trans isomerase
MLVELYDQDKPATVQNFLRYVQSGLYRDMFLHRWVPGSFLQGGGWFMAYRNTSAPVITAVPIYGYITNEFNVGRKFTNTFGTLAMARIGGLVNSASSQWFFNLTNNAYLDAIDGGFTVFGRVALGTNILHRFTIFDPTNGVFRTSLGGALSELPMLSTQVEVNSFVYADISVMPAPRLQITVKADGSRQISWNSIPHFVNRLQSTTTWPPVWQSVVATNGTGVAIQIFDASLQRTFRLYRLRIE